MSLSLSPSRPRLTTTAVTGCPGTYDMAPPPLPPPEQKRLARFRPFAAANQSDTASPRGGGERAPEIRFSFPAVSAPRCLTGASGGEA